MIAPMNPSTNPPSMMTATIRPGLTYGRSCASVSLDLGVLAAGDVRLLQAASAGHHVARRVVLDGVRREGRGGWRRSSRP